MAEGLVSKLYIFILFLRPSLYVVNYRALLQTTCVIDLSLNTSIRDLRLSIRISQSDQLNLVPVLRNTRLLSLRSTRRVPTYMLATIYVV